MRATIPVVLAATLAGQTVPVGFIDQRVAAIPSPTAVTALDASPLLVATQSGTVWRVETGRDPVPILRIPADRICANSERGLLGVAVNSSLPDWVWLYYTHRGPGRDCSTGTSRTPVNRVSRFRLAETVDFSTEQVLLDNIPSFNGNHNAGDLLFGKDGALYVTVGDSGCDPRPSGGCAGRNAIAREPNTLLGKLLRITPDGQTPADNPWRGPDVVSCRNGDAPAGQRCAEVYSTGLRNPYRMAIDPDAETTRILLNDVGQDAWEEIDLAAPGADFGWNLREGPCPNGQRSNCSPDPRFVEPLFSYQHDIPVPNTQSRGCASLSGGAFVPRGVWAPSYDGAYLFADFVCGSIFALRSSTATTTRFEPQATDLLRGTPSITAAAFARLGAVPGLYYTTFTGGGQLRRIVATVAASAASFARGRLAPDSLATIFGVGLANAAAVEVAGQRAPVFFANNDQVNLLIPPGLALGPVSLRVVSSANEVLAQTTAEVAALAPALFSADGSGTGRAAGQIVTTLPGGQPLIEDVSTGLSRAAGGVLVLYGTGLRGAAQVAATIGGAPAQVLYAGPQNEFQGLDQINVSVPPNLIPMSGTLAVRLSADGIEANVLTIPVRN